jgi:hypothetical protein
MAAPASSPSIRLFLRMPEGDKADAYKAFVADMKRICRLVNDQKAIA